MKVIIAGGRDFNNYALLKEKCDIILSKVKEDIIIVSTTDRGAPILGELYANECNYQLFYFNANWRLYGRGSDSVRNKDICEYADSLILFWNEVDKECLDLFSKAKENKMKIRIINYEK